MTSVPEMIQGAWLELKIGRVGVELNCMWVRLGTNHHRRLQTNHATLKANGTVLIEANSQGRQDHDNKYVFRNGLRSPQRHGLHQPLVKSDMEEWI